MEEEIDLRPYITAVIKRWYWIVGAAILSAAIAFIFTSIASPVYEAKASIAIIRSRTDVSFDPRIRTLSEDELESLNANARREALLSLVKSNDIAVLVLNEVRNLLGDEEQKISSLLEMVTTSSDGDLIHIVVAHQNPEVAARIANAWANNFEAHVNTLYGANINDNLDIINTQVTTSEAAYQTAQSEIETFIGSNRIATLQNQIKAKNDLLGVYLDAVSPSDSIKLQVDNRQQSLSNYYDNLLKIEQWLNDARALREQVQADTRSNAADLSNTLALISLRGQVFGGSSPLQLQVSLDTENEGVSLANVEALISVLETRQLTTQAQIQDLSTTLVTEDLGELTITDDHPVSQRMAELNAEISNLEAAKESEEAKRRELERARDLSWETYQTLTRKQAEQEIATLTTGTEVRLASSAIPPEDPVGSQNLSKIVLAGFLGTAVAVFTIFAREWWRQV